MNNFDKILERAKAKSEPPADPVTSDVINKRAEVVGARVKELGFDDSSPKNHRVISRYLTNMILGTADRGLFITGSVGTGKTLAMMLIQKQTTMRRRPAGFVTAQEFGNKVNEDGSYKAVAEYVDQLKTEDWRNGQWDMRSFIYVDLIIDDLGSETDAVHYGVRTEPMIELISARYDLWKAHGARTHITSNLTTVEIQKRYGDRIESRIREMCYVTKFEGNDRRKER